MDSEVIREIQDKLQNEILARIHKLIDDSAQLYTDLDEMRERVVEFKEAVPQSNEDMHNIADDLINTLYKAADAADDAAVAAEGKALPTVEIFLEKNYDV